MKLLQPAVYEGFGQQWVKVDDLFKIAWAEFRMNPQEVWRDLREWQKPNRGLVWTTGEAVMNCLVGAEPHGFGGVYVPEPAAQLFYTQAAAGARQVRFDPAQDGFSFTWEEGKQ